MGRLLPQRTQSVRQVDNRFSSSVSCYYRVLGPPFTPGQLLTSSHLSVHHTQDAYDPQLYIALSSDRAFSVINDCYQSVHHWFDANGFCLNPDKSEAIVIGTIARQRSEPQLKDVTVAGVPVPVTRTVKIDDALSFDDHMQDSTLSHSSSTSHPRLRVSR